MEKYVSIWFKPRVFDPTDLERTMTVRELISELMLYDKDAKVVLEGGDRYCDIRSRSFDTFEAENEEV